MEYKIALVKNNIIINAIVFKADDEKSALLLAKDAIDKGVCGDVDKAVILPEGKGVGDTISGRKA